LRPLLSLLLSLSCAPKGLGSMTRVAPEAGPEHYRELASCLRELARRCRFPLARLELVQLAIEFEARAELLDNGWRDRRAGRRLAVVAWGGS
jgi:hypothetical protein